MIYLRSAPETLVGSFCSRRQSQPASKPQAEKALSSQRTPNTSPPNVQSPERFPREREGDVQSVGTRTTPAASPPPPSRGDFHAKPLLHHPGIPTIQQFFQIAWAHT